MMIKLLLIVLGIILCLLACDRKPADAVPKEENSADSPSFVPLSRK